MSIRPVRSPAEMAAAFAVRHEVFVVEQRVPVEEELDDQDARPTTVHVIAEAEGDVVGTGRLLTDPGHPGEVHIGRLAVRQEWRGHGVGVALMAALEALALARFGVPDPQRPLTHRVRLELSAQEHAIGFYAALGYAVGPDRYLDAGIWHRDAVKDLQGAPDGVPRAAT